MFDPKPSLNKQDPNLARAGAYDDMRKRKSIVSKLVALSFLGAILAVAIFFPLHILIFGGVPLEDRLLVMGRFYGDLGTAIASGRPEPFQVWLSSYWGWYFEAVYNGMMGGGPPSIAPWKLAVTAGLCLIPAILPLSLIDTKTEGLEKTPNIFGDTRWAGETDIEKMSKRDLIGHDGNLFLVGKMKKKLLRMKETLSVLLLAPPGTGKTVAFIVPSTVMMDTSCQLLNDQKPELFHMTSGHRAKLGAVFQLMWSAQDMPEGGWITQDQAELLSPDLIERDETGAPLRNEMNSVRVKPIFYPSWNPIGPASIPPPGPRRDLYIERLVAVLCPDPQGSGDKFWTSKARSALIGMTHFLVAKVELGQDDTFPEITEDGIPALWRGKEASFPMFVDWFTDAQIGIEDSEGEDPMRELFRNAAQEARRIDDLYIARHGKSIMNRAKSEITQLMNSPDKTRGSILTTLDEALTPFKNEAVRQRTATSSFSFPELRGRPKAAARAREEAKVRAAAERGELYQPRYARDEWDPITIYISINAEDAKAFSTITGIFVDSANSYLVANGPGAIDDRGNQLGPYDFFFLLDETPTLPKLDTVINGPATGRSKRVSYAIVGQDFAQIESRYSKAEVETMKSTTAIKVILSQNNESAAKSVSSMAGSMTYRKASYTKKEFGDPVTKFLDMKKEVIGSTNWEKRDFLDPSYVMSMPEGKHIVLVQNFMNRPILSETPRFFEEPEIAKRVYNLRTGKGPKPSLPMPTDLLGDAAEMVEARRKTEQAARNVKAALDSPEAIVVATPRDTSILTHDFDTGLPTHPPGRTFGLGRINLPSDARAIDALPHGEDMILTEDPAEIAEICATRRLYVFDQDDVDALNDLLVSSDLSPLSDELITLVKPEILDIQEESEGDLFEIGYYGYARCDRPHDFDTITPDFAAHWLCEIVSVVHGFRHEYNRITGRG